MLAHLKKEKNKMRKERKKKEDMKKLVEKSKKLHKDQTTLREDHRASGTGEPRRGKEVRRKWMGRVGRGERGSKMMKVMPREKSQVIQAGQ